MGLLSVIGYFGEWTFLSLKEAERKGRFSKPLSYKTDIGNRVWLDRKESIQLGDVNAGEKKKHNCQSGYLSFCRASDPFRITY